MDKLLSTARDLLITIGIFLYFSAWVYIHFYYQQFGISTETLKLDYSSYLVYSYNVLSSGTFLFYASVVLILLMSALILVRVSETRKESSRFFDFIYTRSRKPIDVIKRYPLLFIILLVACLFPVLFEAARSTALANYKDDRLHSGYGKPVQFIFRKDAEILAADSSVKASSVFKDDVDLIRNDTGKQLTLFAETSDYYIVISQPPYDEKYQVLPAAFIYYINKKDVLLAKITLPSLH